MKSPMGEGEFLPAELADEWRADEAPVGFAASVVSVVKEERRGGRAGRRSGVVVPLLLAAFFVSFGAAAAWDSWAKPTSAVELDDAAPDHRKEAMRLSFDVHGAGAWAEKEAERQDHVSPPKRQPPSVEVEEGPVIQEAPLEESQPKQVVHYPSCECGTNGVVCTCID